jgi:hypothetical protein
LVLGVEFQPRKISVVSKPRKRGVYGPKADRTAIENEEEEGEEKNQITNIGRTFQTRETEF